MEEDKQLELVMEIIAQAGEAKSLAMESIRLAKAGGAEAAAKMVAQAEKSANAAHSLHSDLLAYDANNGDLRIDFLTVHAADHLTAADVTVEMAREFTELYRLLLQKQ